MKFTVGSLNVRARQMKDIAKIGQQDDLDSLIAFLEEKGIKGNMSMHSDHMVEVPNHIRKIVEVPQG